MDKEIVLIVFLHGAVCPLLMILIPCAIDDTHSIFSKGARLDTETLAAILKLTKTK